MSNEAQSSPDTINNMKIDKNKSVHQVTFQDLIIFKEDILKELRNYKVKISNSVNVEFEKYTDLLEKSNRNLNYYEKDKSSFMSKLDFVQEKEKLFTDVINKTNELRNEVMINQLHISGCRKDIDNSCYKYDKVISDNLLVPGIIGKSCKFGNLKEYIIYNKEEMNNAFMGNRQNANDLNVLRRKVDTNTAQLNTKIKSLEYRLSNFITSKYHEVDSKFDRLYEELNKRMNSLSYEVNSNIEERKNELARLKNFVFEENAKAIESVKAIKNDIINEFDLMKKNFKKIKKNIVSLTNLLMGRTHNMNKQLVINNFNNMMLELFKEFNVAEGIEIKKPEIQQTKTLRRSVKPAVDSCIKQYIEGKISVNDAKFHGEKMGLKRKKSLQLSDKMLLGFNKEEVQRTVTTTSINKNNNSINNNNNSNNNNNNNNSSHDNNCRNENSAKINKSFKSRLSQVITFNPNMLEKNIMPKTEPKKAEKIYSNKDVTQFKVEPFNNAIQRTNTTAFLNNKKKIKNDEVINEEDSNKYNSSKSNNNSFEIKNKKNGKKEKGRKNEKRKSSYNLVKQNIFDLNLSSEKKNEKRNTFYKVDNININIDGTETKNKIIEFSENSSSSIKLENSTEIKNRNYYINSPDKPNLKASYRKSYSKDFKLSEDLTDYNNNNYNFKIKKNENNNSLNESDKKNFLKKIQNIEIDGNNKDEEAKVIERQNIEVENQNKYENDHDIKLNQNKNVNQNMIVKNEEKIINQKLTIKNKENIINQNINLKNEDNIVNQNKVFKNENQNFVKQNTDDEKNKYIEEYNSLNNNIKNLEKAKIKKYEENNKIYNHKKQQHKVISHSTENSLNYNIIEKSPANINAFRNFKSNIPQSMKRENDDKLSFLNKVSGVTKLSLTKNNDMTKIRNDSFIKTDNNYINNMAKTQNDKFQFSINKLWENAPRMNSPFIIKNKQVKDDNLIISPNKENLASTSKNSNSFVKSVHSSNTKEFFNNKTRNKIINNTEGSEKFNSFDKQKIIANNNKNINNGMPPILKTDMKKKLNNFELERANIFKDDKDIYLSKENIKNVRYVKDEDIIDQPLILDVNNYKFDQRKGNLENRLMELEYFTKKKLDELVREIKIFIPIHFNSYIKNYSIDKSK